MSHHDDVPSELALLAAPPPRRTDAAFARAVADDVKRRRAPFALWLGAPALALAAAGVAIVVVGPGTGVVSVDAGVAASRIASIDLGRGDLEWGEDSEFAIPSLDGSTDEELMRLDLALDLALERGRRTQR